MNRVAEIAKKAGVINSLDDIEKLQCEDAEGVTSKLQVSALCKGDKPPNDEKYKHSCRHTLAEFKSNRQKNSIASHRFDLQVSGRVLCELKFNVCLRETIAAAFVAIFQSYDKFVIMPCLDEHGLWTFSTETQDNFDKVCPFADFHPAQNCFCFI